VGVVGVHVVLVDRKLVLEVQVVVEEAGGVVWVEAVLVDHKLVPEVAVVRELLLELVGVADRTALPALVVAVRMRWFLQQRPQSLPVRPTRETRAQQTLAPTEAREQQTYRRLPELPFSAPCSSPSGCSVAERPVTQDRTSVKAKPFPLTGLGGL
jgi:hypothetical protein